MKKPEISILCTTFDHGPFIAAALDGFLAQRISVPYEIIVHDDASTDNTQEVIRKYQKRQAERENIKDTTSCYPLCLLSSDTVSFFLPLALLLANTLRPLADAILSLNPCLFLLFLCEGWNVLFILLFVYKLNWPAKISN